MAARTRHSRAAETLGDQARAHQDGEEDPREGDGRTNLERVGLDRVFAVIEVVVAVDSRERESDQQRDGGQTPEESGQLFSQCRCEEGDQDPQPDVHDPGGGDDGAGVGGSGVGAALGLPGEDDRGHRRGVCAADDAGEEQRPVAESELEQVAGVRHAADRHHHQPDLERVDPEGCERVIRNRRQDDRSENQKPQKGPQLFRRYPQSETLEAAFFMQQDDGDDPDAEGEPVHLCAMLRRRGRK